jgi:hypothetical protein
VVESEPRDPTLGPPAFVGVVSPSGRVAPMLGSRRAQPEVDTEQQGPPQPGVHWLRRPRGSRSIVTARLGAVHDCFRLLPLRRVRWLSSCSRPPGLRRSADVAERVELQAAADRVLAALALRPLSLGVSRRFARENEQMSLETVGITGPAAK